LVKSGVTSQAREVAKLGREMLGGNGILLDYNIMKHMLDIEVIYTYEGTYDINVLVAGRDITGVSAIKSSYTLKN